ncbi:hypothetical protein J3A83DRAFT_4249789 [Scleroderma citrinum]
MCKQFCFDDLQLLDDILIIYGVAVFLVGKVNKSMESEETHYLAIYGLVFIVCIEHIQICHHTPAMKCKLSSQRETYPHLPSTSFSISYSKRGNGLHPHFSYPTAQPCVARNP